MDLAAISIGIDPTIELGPLTLAWHGIGIAAGIAVGAAFGRRYAIERGLDPEALLSAVVVIALAGIVGARLFFFIENDPGALVQPGELFGSNGFAFYGAMIFGTLAAALFLWRSGLGLRYLDAMAAGFPIGMAVGRLGDVINGEHYGPPSDAPWAVRNTHPDADVPSPDVAYHSGGLYEVVLALVMFAVIWPLRHRFKEPLVLLWGVVGLYGLGRFLMFFYRSDSEDVALGFNGAQWTSLALVGMAVIGIAWARQRRPAAAQPGAPRSSA